MRAFGWFIITLLLGACSADKPSKSVFTRQEICFSVRKKRGGMRYILVGNMLIRCWCIIPRKREFAWRGLAIFRRLLARKSDTLNRIGI